MAVLDSLEDFAVVVASNHASIAVQTLLPQGVLPLTMLFSYLILRARYHKLQLLGAAVILGGVVLVVIPLFQQPAGASDNNSTFFSVGTITHDHAHLNFSI